MVSRFIKRFTTVVFTSFVGIACLSLAFFTFVPLFTNDAIGASSRYDRIESHANATRMFDPVQLKPIPKATPSDPSFSDDIGEISIGAVAAAATFTIPRLESVDLKSVLWSQAQVTGKSETYRELMINGKWNWEPTNAGEIVHAVRTSKGVGLIDNTRAAVALDLGRGNMLMQVHEATDLLPDSANQIGANGIRRFGNAKTWGEAFDYRVADQWKSYKQIVQPGGNTAPPMFKVLGRRAGTGAPILQGLSTDGFASSTFSIGKKGQMSFGGTLTEVSSSGTITRTIDAVTDVRRTNIAGAIGSSTVQTEGILVRTEGLLARTLQPVLNTLSTVTKTIAAPIVQIGEKIAALSPTLATLGVGFLKGSGAVFTFLGKAAPVIGVVLGGLMIGMGGAQIVDLFRQEGVDGVISPEGISTSMNTIASVLDTAAAAVLAIGAISGPETLGVGTLTGLAISGLLMLGAYAIRSGAKSEWFVEGASKVAHEMKDAVMRGAAWVGQSADAMLTFSRTTAQTIANRTVAAVKNTATFVQHGVSELSSMAARARQEVAIVTAAAIERARQEAAAAVALAKQIAEAAAEKVRQEAAALAERIRQSEIAAALERARQEAAAVAAALAERVRLAAIAAAALARQVAEAAAERARQEAAAVAAAIVAAAALAERTRQAAIAAAAALAERVRQEAIAAAAAIERARQEAAALAAAVAERARQAAAAVAAEAERVRQAAIAAAAAAAERIRREVAAAAAAAVERARREAAALAERIRQSEIAAALERARQAAIATAAALAERARQEAAAAAERVRQAAAAAAAFARQVAEAAAERARQAAAAAAERVRQEAAAVAERARQAAAAAAVAIAVAAARARQEAAAAAAVAIAVAAARARQEAAAAAERVRQAAAVAAQAAAARVAQAAAAARQAAQAAAARVAQAAAAARQAAASAASRVVSSFRNFFRAPAPARSSGRRR